MSFFFILLICLTFSGCDFSSPLNKDILEAQEHLYHHKYEKAIELYKKILLKNPPDKVKSKILFEMSELYMTRLNSPESSAKTLELLLNESDDLVWPITVRDRLGEIYFSYLHQNENALRHYKVLANFRPKLEKSDFYDFRLVEIYQHLGDKSELLKSLTVIQENPLHEYFLEAYFRLGLYWFQEQEWTKAIDIWNNYLKKERRTEKIFETRFLIGNAYETMEKSEEAYQIYYSLLGKYPNTEVLKGRLKAIYIRRLARKR